MKKMEDNQDFDDLIVFEDLDLTDDSQLRKVVAEVESLLGVQGKGLRVSILTAEQWELVITRMIDKNLRRGAELYFHMIKDPRDPQHLLVSPSAVQSINEGSRQIYQELIYSTMRCIPTDLSHPLRRGIDDLLAQECSQRVDVEFNTRNYPLESAFAENLLNTIVVDFSYTTINWAIMLRRSPKRVISALMKSNFYSFWKQEISKDFKITRNNDLDKLITAKKLPVRDDIFKRTQQLMIEYQEKNS